MKQFISFVKKEFYHIIRDKRTLLILLGIPVMQILLFGFAITTEVKNARVAVFDPSHDAATRHITERFRSSRYFTMTEELRKAEEIEDLFKHGQISLAIVFSDHFAENLLRTGKASVRLITDGTEPNQAAMINGYAMNILNMYRQESASNGQIPCHITTETKMLYNPQSKSIYYFVPGLMGMIMTLICAMMTSIAIVREKETGTMEVLLASPTKPEIIIPAKIIPYFMLSVLNLTTILILSVFVLKVPVTGNLFLLIAVSLLFITLVLSSGLLVSNLVNSQMAAMLVSGMGTMMPVILLSGMIYPIESMPMLLQWISTVVPARWYIEAVKKIMIQGAEMQFVLKEISMLAMMTIVFVMAGLKTFKHRLD